MAGMDMRAILLFMLGLMAGMVVTEYMPRADPALGRPHKVADAVVQLGARTQPPPAKHQQQQLAPAAPAAVDINRVLFIVITGEVNHNSRVKTILQTWGKWIPRERLLLISDSQDNALGTIGTPGTGGGHAQSQRKWYFAATIAANVSRHGLEADWFVVADDDTFLLVPNVLQFLAGRDPKQPAWFGQMCSPTECAGPCVCGGGGWAASAKLFLDMADAFSAAGWPPKCCEGMYYSDQTISKYLNTVPKTPLTNSREWGSQPPDWYLHTDQGYKDKPHGWGRACSFHYLDESCVKTRVLYALAIAMFPGAEKGWEY
jgi:hypothetical protein